MTYITVKEASEKWNISERRICVLCTNGRIPGAIKKSKVWMIPSNSKKPEDGRRATSSDRIEPSILLYNCSYFEDRGIKPTTKEEKSICEIQQKYLSGRLDEAYADLCRMIGTCEDHKYLFVFYVLRIIILADFEKNDEFVKTMRELDEFIDEHELLYVERLIISFYKGRLDRIDKNVLCSEIYDELMPLFSLLSAKCSMNNLINNGRFSEIANLEIICRELEGKNVSAILAYYHLYLAVYYNATYAKDMYEYHIRKAVDILLPRKWYTPLAEYSATIDLRFIKEIDADAYKTIDSLSQTIIESYIKNGIFDALSDKPRMNIEKNIQVGFKIVQGKNNETIAKELDISEYKVKQHIDDLCMVLGVNSKKEIKEFILKNFFV